jgi:hypothetical protein
MSFVAAGAFTLVAVASLLYSVAIYLYRAQAIRERKAVQYHDSWGPSVLCGCVFIAILLNGWFELKARRIV